MYLLMNLAILYSTERHSVIMLWTGKKDVQVHVQLPHRSQIRLQVQDQTRHRGQILVRMTRWTTRVLGNMTETTTVFPTE